MYLDERKVIRSLIAGRALSDILLFIVNSMSWILRVSNDGSPSTNDITKNQSERLRNIEPSLLRSSTIFKMAAAGGGGGVECVDERMHPDINELLSEAVRRYPILYDKTLKEFKDRKMKSQKLKLSQFNNRMLAILPEIIFPVTQPKLFDKVIVLAICS